MVPTGPENRAALLSSATEFDSLALRQFLNRKEHNEISPDAGPYYS